MISGQKRSSHRANRHNLDLNNYVPALLVWLTNKLSSEASRTYRAWYGLGVTDWRVLAYLGVHETGTAAAICRLIGLDKAATSRSLAILKKRGLIRHKQLKGRNVELSITEMGREKYEVLLAFALEREKALLRGLSLSERKALISMLHRMLGNLGAVAELRPSMATRRPTRSSRISAEGFTRRQGRGVENRKT